MTRHDDFEPDIPPEEREELEHLAARLVTERPVPRAAFRGELRRRLAAPAPRGRARLGALAYLVSGVALLAVAAFGVNDVGPLAPRALPGPAEHAHVPDSHAVVRAHVPHVTSRRPS